MDSQGEVRRGEGWGASIGTGASGGDVLPMAILAISQHSPNLSQESPSVLELGQAYVYLKNTEIYRNRGKPAENVW